MTLTAGAQQSFDESVVPAGYRKYIEGTDVNQAVEAEPEDDQLSPIQKLQLGTVKEIKEAIPHLNEEKLKELHDLEERSEEPRSGALSAIATELLSHASTE